MTSTQQSFETYIYRVLKQVHPDTGISGEALSEMDNLNSYLIKRVMETCNLLLKKTKRMTLTSREVQSAVRMVLPGELAKHAVSEGTKAVTKFNSSSNEPVVKGQKKKPTTRQWLAGLQFSVSRVENHMRALATTERMGKGAPVYLAGVLEYISAEILELSGNASRDLKRQRISSRHILLAISNDDELNKFYCNVTLGSGVIPHINSALIKKSKK